MQQPRYAFFDFDGTLISQDSFVVLWLKTFRKAPWRLLLLMLLSPFLLCAIFLRLDKAYVKSCVLWSLTCGRGKKNAVIFLRETLLCDQKISWFLEVEKTFSLLKEQGIEIVVITASGQIWVRALLRQKFQHLRMIVGSQLGFFAGGVVLKSKNCFGKEKIVRIHQLLGQNFSWHSAWSDHLADLPLLLHAPSRYIICPKKRHLHGFSRGLKTNFKILKWTSVSKKE
jgi:phosphatidylglycerophosphatase C